MLATVCGVDVPLNAANCGSAFTPPPKWCNCTDSVCTKAHLQNFETCMRNIHWQVFVSQKMHEKFQVLVREILVLLYIIAHSASHFMRRIGKKRTWLQFQHPNFVCFDAYKAKYVHTAIHDF